MKTALEILSLKSCMNTRVSEEKYFFNLPLSIFRYFYKCKVYIYKKFKRDRERKRGNRANKNKSATIFNAVGFH